MSEVGQKGEKKKKKREREGVVIQNDEPFTHTDTACIPHS
jgi:hypothetical protein